MIEYTLLATASVVVVITVDLLVLRTRLVTQWPIVLYGEQQYLGIRLDTIPLEDFLFGFSLISTTIMRWEYLGVRTVFALAPFSRLTENNYEDCRQWWNRLHRCGPSRRTERREP
jgi:lycopene cyclase domain-containing protein